MPPTTFVDRVLDQGEAIVTYAVPFFFLMIAIEAAFIVAAGRDYLRLTDSIAALSCGTLEQLLGVFLKTIVFGGYVLVYENWRLLEVRELSLPAKLAAAFVLFLGVDFCFYWFHRFAHVMALPWATHVVHHSSEELNLIVALRQSAFEDVIAAVFYLPLAWIGFPPAWFAAMFSFNLNWQFWCHTRMVGKLGPIEWVFNTPSHHRVHHARNPEYLDKNYAGTLIVWDRLFGTFVEERAEPVYGITKPLASWNPWWANFHYWVELAQLSREAPYAWDKIKLWFMPLGWTPRGLEPRRYAVEITPADVLKYETPVPRGLASYVLLQFALTLALGFGLMTQADHGAPLTVLALPSLAVFWGLLNFGGLFEGRRWALVSEAARLLAVAIGTALWVRSAPWSGALLTLVALLGVASLAWLFAYRHTFQRSAFVAAAPAGLAPRAGASQNLRA